MSQFMREWTGRPGHSIPGTADRTRWGSCPNRFDPRTAVPHRGPLIRCPRPLECLCCVSVGIRLWSRFNRWKPPLSSGSRPAERKYVAVAETAQARSGSQARSDAHCAPIVGDWEEAGGEYPQAYNGRAKSGECGICAGLEAAGRPAV